MIERVFELVTCSVCQHTSGRAFLLASGICRGCTRIAELEAEVARLRLGIRRGRNICHLWDGKGNGRRFAALVLEHLPPDEVDDLREALTPTTEGSNASGAADDSQGGEG